jgi:uncharacterized membrane protein
MRPRIGLARGLVAVAVVAALTGLGATLWWHDALTYDVGVYRHYGEAMASGQVPYRDFRLEYPPGALPVFAVPALMTDSVAAYRAAFAVEAACLEIGVLLAGLSLLGRLNVTRQHQLGYVAFGALVAAFPLGSVALTRFDFWPALLLLLALAFAAADRTRAAGVTLGAAIAAKIFPLVVLPLLLAHAWRRGGVREARRLLISTLATVVVVFLPFTVVAPRSVASSLWEQFSRPLQIESVGSAAVIALHRLFGVAADSAYSHGSDNLTGTAASAATAVTAILLLLVLCCVWIGYLHGPAESHRLIAYAAAAVAAFVALGKVLSPQFLLWLLPLVPLVRGRRGVTSSALLGLAAALTTIWIPFRQVALTEFAPLPSWALLIRDLILVAVVFTLVPVQVRTLAGASVTRAFARVGR